MRFNRIPSRLQKRPLSTFLKINLKVYGFIEAVESKVAAVFKDRTLPDGEIVPGLFKRSGAFLLDSILIVLLLFLGEKAGALFFDAEYLLVFYVYLLTLLFPVYFVVTGLVWLASPGKLVFGMAIANSRGRKLGRLQVVLRELVKYVFLGAAPVIVIVALFNKRLRTLADWASSTRIVYR